MNGEAGSSVVIWVDAQDQAPCAVEGCGAQTTKRAQVGGQEFVLCPDHATDERARELLSESGTATGAEGGGD